MFSPGYIAVIAGPKMRLSTFHHHPIRISDQYLQFCLLRVLFKGSAHNRNFYMIQEIVVTITGLHLSFPEFITSITLFPVMVFASVLFTVLCGLIEIYHDEGRNFESALFQEVCKIFDAKNNDTVVVKYRRNGRENKQNHESTLGQSRR